MLRVPKRLLFNSSGQITVLLSHCSPQGNESDSWLLTSHWLFCIKKKVCKCFISCQQAINMSPKFLLWLYLIFPRCIFEACFLLLLLLLLNMLNEQKQNKTWFEKITSESIKLWGMWFAKATFCCCMYPSRVLFGWNPVPMKSKPSLKWLQCVLLSVSA